MSGSGPRNPYRVTSKDEPQTQPHWLTLNWKGVMAVACLILSIGAPLGWWSVNKPPGPPSPCVETVTHLGSHRNEVECVSGKAKVTGDIVLCKCEEKEVADAE